MIADFLLGGIIDLIFDLFWILFTRKRMEGQEWQGTVEKKRATSGHSLSRYGYVVYFRDDEDRRRKLRMKRGDFDLYQEGKRYHKKSGEYLPDPATGI